MKEGARLLLGGRQCDMPGLYMEPTIFADVEDGTFIAIEESFGPVMVPISKKTTKKESKTSYLILFSVHIEN